VLPRGVADESPFMMSPQNRGATQEDAPHRPVFMILTEQDVCNQCERESAGGRVPPEIEFVRAVIPENLRARLVAARLKFRENVRARQWTSDEHAI
jgi:hypothetical protein